MFKNVQKQDPGNGAKNLQKVNISLYKIIHPIDLINLRSIRK